MKNNKKYVIIPIKHLLKNNETAKAGEVISGNKFIDLQYALANGICKESKSVKKLKKVDKTDLKTGDTPESKTVEKNIRSLSVKKLNKFVEKNDLKVDLKQNKPELIEAVLKALESTEEEE